MKNGRNALAILLLFLCFILAEVGGGEVCLAQSPGSPSAVFAPQANPDAPPMNLTEEGKFVNPVQAKREKGRLFYDNDWPPRDIEKNFRKLFLSFLLPLFFILFYLFFLRGKVISTAKGLLGFVKGIRGMGEREKKAPAPKIRRVGNRSLPRGKTPPAREVEREIVSPAVESRGRKRGRSRRIAIAPGRKPGSPADRVGEEKKEREKSLAPLQKLARTLSEVETPPILSDLKDAIVERYKTEPLPFRKGERLVPFSSRRIFAPGKAPFPFGPPDLVTASGVFLFTATPGFLVPFVEANILRKYLETDGATLFFTSRFSHESLGQMLFSIESGKNWGDLDLQARKQVFRDTVSSLDKYGRLFLNRGFSFSLTELAEYIKKIEEIGDISLFIIDDLGIFASRDQTPIGEILSHLRVLSSRSKFPVFIAASGDDDWWKEPGIEDKFTSILSYLPVEAEAALGNFRSRDTIILKVRVDRPDSDSYSGKLAVNLECGEMIDLMSLSKQEKKQETYGVTI